MSDPQFCRKCGMSLILSMVSMYFDGNTGKEQFSPRRHCPLTDPSKLGGTLHDHYVYEGPRLFGLFGPKWHDVNDYD